MTGGRNNWEGGEKEEQWEGVINERGRRRKEDEEDIQSIYCGGTGGEDEEERKTLKNKIHKTASKKDRNLFHSDSIINIFPLSFVFMQKKRSKVTSVKITSFYKNNCRLRNEAGGRPHPVA